jgi:hypothetical protein
MRTVIDWLSEARHVNRLISTTLRVLAVFLVPYGLLVFFKAGKILFELPATGILGGIFFQMFFVVAVYSATHGLFLRAHDIDSLPGKDYNMFPLAALVFRAIGEALGVFIALVSIGGGIFIWFTGRAVATIMSPPPRFLPAAVDTNFMGGIELIISGVLSAVAVLGISYLAAEVMKFLESKSGKL